jgi:hypothetical protein
VLEVAEGEEEGWAGLLAGDELPLRDDEQELPPLVGGSSDLESS